ncbi:MAG: VWA domain-containing protein, partial [Planctomycetota bacterium]
GFPVEKSKALARKAIASMRAGDTFNFITFAGATSVLWPEPRAANEENRKLAEDFVNGAYGAGGTEMMAAINAALVQDGRSGILPAKLLDMPADGRTVRIAVAHNGFLRDVAGTTLDAGEGRTIPVELSIAMPANPKKLAIIVDGTWETRNGNRLFSAKSAKFEDADARTRFVFFLTDGYIGNDQAVVAAVGQNARASRVFSFGIGNSVNRFLLEEMARAGRGTCEIVTLADEADGVIERLTRRIESPVLTDIELDISANLGIHDLLPAGDHLPDLYDQEPIVLMGRFDHAASGSITVRGRTGAGAWERTISVVLPETQAEHDVVKTLWARAKVDALLLPKLAAVENQSLDAPTKRAVIRLGESYSIATAYTSFVAIEKSRVVVGGKPLLVAVPVELPDGTNWAGFFGEGVRPVDAIIAESRGRSSVELESLAKTASTRGLISAWTDFDG